MKNEAKKGLQARLVLGIMPRLKPRPQSLLDGGTEG
jgi:hypothetical protein